MANIFKRVGRSGAKPWYARYRCPIAGKDVKKKLKARTKREAELELALILKDISDDDFEIRKRQSEIRFFEIADDYLAYSIAHKRSSIKDGRTIKRLKGFFGDILCKQFYRSMVDRYIADRKQQKGRKGKTIQSSTTNRELACLKTIFRRAHLDGKIARNPMAGFKLLPEDNVRDRVLSNEEYQSLLFAAPHHIRPLLVIAWETGMRKGEIFSLKWEQIDMKNGLIHLHGENTKTGKSRKVPISPFLMNTLNKQKRINEWVFTYKGRRLRDIRTAFVKACERAGIEDFRFHDLRHCFVTRMFCREGVSDRVIMAITGHVTMECFKRYDTISVDDLRLAVGVEVSKSWNKSGTSGTL